jgi:hypothetical protein
MSLSRRKFMKAGIVAAACATLPLKSALGRNVQENRGWSLLGKTGTQAQVSDKMGLEQLDYLTQSSFTPYVNTQFRVYLSPSSVRGLKLMEVSDFLATLPKSESKGSLNKTEGFSLLLTLPPGKSFEQDTYLIEHDALGNFYMFLVPVGEKGKKGFDYYEAVVYRNPQLPKGYEPAVANGQQQAGAQVAPGQLAKGNIIGTSSAGQKTEQDVYYFRPQAIASSAAPAQPIVPGAAGRRVAGNLNVAQAPSIGGLKLGMTIEQVLALFPGVKDDAEVRSSLSRPTSKFGVQSFSIKPGKYSSNRNFDRVSQVAFMFLDGRVVTLSLNYAGPVWNHVDEFVAKISGETGLPAADSWDAYVGMETQLKTLRCKDFEVSVFAGGNSVNLNYVQMSDTTAQQTLKGRRAKARNANGAKP